MKIKISEAEGLQLDWGVAAALELKPSIGHNSLGGWRVAAFCEKGKRHKAHGKTLAESVARCVISMRLGDEFEVPDELGVMS